MKKQIKDSKTLILEMMSKIDSTFKPRLNEWGDENSSDYDNNPNNFETTNNQNKTGHGLGYSIQPEILRKIAEKIKFAIDKHIISVNEKIDNSKYEFGAYATGESWNVLYNIFEKFKNMGLISFPDNIDDAYESIDNILDQLEKHDLIYLEW